MVSSSSGVVPFTTFVDLFAGVVSNTASGDFGLVIPGLFKLTASVDGDFVRVRLVPLVTGLFGAL